MTRSRWLDIFSSFDSCNHDHEASDISECVLCLRPGVDGRLDADGVGSVVEYAALSADRLNRDVVVQASRAEEGEGI